jgi:hypothetical protein
MFLAKKQRTENRFSGCPKTGFSVFGKNWVGNTNPDCATTQTLANKAQNPRLRHPSAKLACPTHINRRFDWTGSGLLYFCRSKQKGFLFHFVAHVAFDVLWLNSLSGI